MVGLYNPAMLKIVCEGLSFAEVKELQHCLRVHEGVESVQLDLKLEGIQRQVWLIVKVAASTGAVAGIVGSAVKGAADEAGKDLYRLVKEWLSKKGNHEAQVSLNDANGRLIEKVRKDE